jgi:hypothetical protein
MTRFVYSNSYIADLGLHVFPIEKYSLVARALREFQTDGRLLADRALSRLLKKDWPRTLDELEQHRRSRMP